FEWVRHWCDHFLAEPTRLSGVDLCIVTARIGPELVMIWPLVRECRLGQCHIKWIGEPVSQYGDTLVANRPDADALISAGLDFISAALGEDMVILRKVRSDSRVANVLQRRGNSMTSASDAPFIALPPDTSFASFETRYPAKARKNRRRHRRRLEEKGVVGFEVIREGSRARDMVRLAIGYTRSWLQARGLVSRAFSDARLDSFFEKLAIEEDGGCQLRAFVLTCDGHPVAVNIGFVSGRRMLTHIAAYDPEYERYSPGSLLFEASIKACLENGIAVFDFLSPDDGYKRIWADDSVTVNDYAIGLTRKGRAYDALYIQRLRPVMKYAMLQMPRLVRPFSRMFNL
ncbi:MAG: GNAT family N-acetyltransferase, partial [Hyphomicrobiaceae bacterium]